MELEVLLVPDVLLLVVLVPLVELVAATPLWSELLESGGGGGPCIPIVCRNWATAMPPARLALVELVSEVELVLSLPELSLEELVVLLAPKPPGGGGGGPCMA